METLEVIFTMTPIGNTLRELRQRLGYQQVDVVKKLSTMGVEATQQKVSRWEIGRNMPTIEQFLGLCKLYGIKDVHRVFVDQDFSELVFGLNKEGREKLEEYRDLLIASGKYAPAQTERKVMRFPDRTLPLFSIGASAGTGQFLDSSDYEMVEVPDDVPISATFGLHVTGDSMEPTLEDGQLIWVHQQPHLENGDIGIFYIDGNAYVKEYRQTAEGVFLISHNEKYEPIRVSADSENRIYGKVVYPA